MKRKFSVLLLLLGCQVWASFELPSKPIKYKGVDITPAVKILSQYVKTLKKDYSVYHWDNSAQEGQNEKMVLAAKKMGNFFWARYGRPDNGMQGVYGDGLYLATDPLSTHGFGGSSQWSLLQLTLPRGLRIADLASSFSLSEKELETLKTIFSQWGCSSFTDMHSFFFQGGAGLSVSCQGLAKTIFKETLKIDGFAYSYEQSPFKSCDKDSAFFGRAFVITNPQWIESNQVSFFTAQSNFARTDRVKIQTLFLLNEETILQIPLPFTKKDIQTLKEYWMIHPQGVITETNMLVNNESTYRLVVKLCKAGEEECTVIPLEGIYPKLIPFNTVITSKEAQSGDPRVTSRAFSKSNGQVQYLLWSDLEGQAKATDLKEWIRGNFFGCERVSPFVEDINAISPDLGVQNEK